MTNEVAGGVTGAARSEVVEDAPVTRIKLVEMTEVDVDRVPAILGATDAPWLGERAETAAPADRSFLCDLELHAGTSGRALFRKAAIVTLGEPIERENGWDVPVEWRATSMSALFPVLVGQVHVAGTWIGLEGHYAPPGGRVGHLLDSALLGTAARQTGRWFLRTVVEALQA